MSKKNNQPFLPIALPIFVSFMPFFWVYSHMGLSVLALLMGIVSTISVVRPYGWDTVVQSIHNNKAVMVGIAIILGWGLITSPWAINPEYAINNILKYAMIIPIIPMVMLARMADKKTARRTQTIFVIGFLVGILILVPEKNSCHNLPDDDLICGLWGTALGNYHYNNNFFVFALLSPIVGMILAARQTTLPIKIASYGIVQIITIIALMSAINAASWLVFGIVQIAFVGGIILPRLIRWGIVATAFIIGIGIIPISHYIVQNYAHQLQYKNTHLGSEKMRIEMWDYAGTVAGENPITGVGFKNSRFVPDTDKPFLSLIENHDSKEKPIPNIAIYNHPHNMFVELRLELGTIGVGLAFALILILAGTIAKSPPILQPYYLAMMAGSFTLYNVGLSLWRGWWVAFILIVIAMLPLLIQQDDND